MVDWADPGVRSPELGTDGLLVPDTDRPVYPILELSLETEPILEWSLDRVFPPFPAGEGDLVLDGEEKNEPNREVDCGWPIRVAWIRCDTLP
jgi:hypothetical protein